MDIINASHGFKDAQFTSQEKSDMATLLGIDSSTVNEICNYDYCDYMPTRLALARIMDLEQRLAALENP